VQVGEVDEPENLLLQVLNSRRRGVHVLSQREFFEDARVVPRSVVILSILVGLAVAGIVRVASYRGGASNRADADTPNPPIAAIAVAASALNGTISEKQMTSVVRVTRTRELPGKD
jgi:hypothetical protein